MAAVRLNCRVTPKAKKSGILGWVTDEQGVQRLKIKLAAPPVDGKANRELVRFLSKELGVAKSGVKLVSGEKSRLKTVQIAGMDQQRLENVLEKI